MKVRREKAPDEKEFFVLFCFVSFSAFHIFEKMSFRKEIDAIVKNQKHKHANAWEGDGN